MIACEDCERDLSQSRDWEPVLLCRLGEWIHASICYACIECMEDVGFAELIAACREEILHGKTTAS